MRRRLLAALACAAVYLPAVAHAEELSVSVCAYLNMRPLSGKPFFCRAKHDGILLTISAAPGHTVDYMQHLCGLLMDSLNATGQLGVFSIDIYTADLRHASCVNPHPNPNPNDEPAYHGAGPAARPKGRERRENMTKLLMAAAIAAAMSPPCQGG